MKKFDEQTAEIARFYDKSPIFDGIIDENEYSKSKIKILWILKEANSTGEDDVWDLREAIGNLKTEFGIKKGWEKTFRKIIYVVNGISKGLEWDNIPYASDEPDIIDELKKIAFINIKKVGGVSVANDNEIQEFYDKSKELLLNQIETYNPDVIIFGNTFKYFENDLNLNQLNKFGTCEATAKNNRIYISAYHPGARISEKNYFDDILKAFRAFNKQIETLQTKYIQLEINELQNSLINTRNHLENVKNHFIEFKEYDSAAVSKDMLDDIENAITKFEENFKN